MLGRPYCLRGKVVRGEGRGRRLAYPTANLAVDDFRKMLPRPGIYAARVILGGATYGGALYVGTKPTYGGGPVAVEVHLIGIRANLYGRKLEVAFVDRLRDEREFKGDAALKRAIASDIRRAGRALGN
jgi:riboflavin kinase/FMN adenylyltransferase